MMMLDKSEIRELTGYYHRSKQCKALWSMGIVHTVNGRGDVIVLKEEVNRHLLGGSKKKRLEGPRLEAV